MIHSTRLKTCLALLLAHVAAASADNFLTNGDAETGTLAGWVATPPGVAGAVTQVSQSTGIVTPFAGNFFFTFTGMPAPSAMMHQVGAVAPHWTGLRLTGMVQTETTLGNTDTGEAILSIHDSNGSVLVSASSGPLVTANFQWNPFQVKTSLPEGAAEWKVVLNGSLFSGIFINVFWDELKLELCSPADLNGDCVVGVADLLILLADWGPCDDPTPGTCPADLNNDGAVGVADLLILLANWG